VKKDWVEAEFRNWARWCNLGGTNLPWGVSAECLFDEDEAPIPIHEESAKRVQKIFDSAIFIERKVLQAEYLSPWRYSRNNGIAAAARVLELSAPAYETILTSMKRCVERAFQ
jgi:hypothetical protein